MPATQPSQDQILSAAFTQLASRAGVGFALALDVGGMITVPLPKGYPKWTLAAVVNDLGQTTFRAYNGMRLPERVNQAIHFGFF